MAGADLILEIAAEAAALQSIKGCAFALAAAFSAEVGDFTRFRSGRQVTAYFGLAPGVPPRVVAEEVTAHGVAVLVVGHEPGISALGAHLVGRPSFPPFRPGQVTLIEDGVARWSLSPDRLEIEPILVA